MKNNGTDEYYELVNRYAITEVGRMLSQTEVDEIIDICDSYDEGEWGEEHLIEALTEWNKQ